jgi:geranylgeranyl pyrophosphate synthase
LSIEEFLKEKAVIIDRVIEKYIPRKFDEDALIFQLKHPRYGYNLEALNKAIAEPIWEFLDRGGKRWRPSLFLLVCEALGKSWEDFLDLAIIPEVIHNGTLMIDDVEDLSELRRGKPCTYKLFGLDVAINAGNAMYYLPLLSLIRGKHRLSPEKVNKIYEAYIQEMIHLSFGQATDIAWHRDLPDIDEINEAQYFQMCAYKSGTIPRLSAKIAAIISGASHTLVERLGTFAEAISVAFQIQDDVLDLVEEKFAEKKGGRGQDITEGKLTLVVIHALKHANPKERERLVEILKMHTEDQRLKNEAIDLMKKCGSTEYAKKSACALVEKSWDEVDELLPPSDAKNKLRALADYLVNRKI